ncbi:MAG TPA: diguanylate cyclase [Syntrophaceticus sp.]|nr:diguanylate cyclase [Syntrophaceticus sp.]
MIKSLFVVSVAEQYKREFVLTVNEINVRRVKVTAITFIILEGILIIISLVKNKSDFFKQPDVYYSGMYVLLFIASILYLLVFIKLGKNIPASGTLIQVIGISFTCLLLYWCVGIALLDQLSYGQIIVYIVALISIAAVPFFPPLTVLLIFFSAQALFIAFMPYFQQSTEILYGNYINSTAFLIIAWVISCIRYISYVEDFEHKKIIQEKSDELERVNKELEEANQKLEKLSQTDSLTGIFNRSVFDRTIRAEWDRCKRHHSPLSLIMVDIDIFKAYNDNYGHQAGDDCIRWVAQSLRACVKRSSDIVARYGGDEFAVILPHVNRDTAVQFADQIRKKVLELAIPHPFSPVSPYLTISAGVQTLIPSDELSIEKLIRTADQALYEAKKEHNEVVGI